MNVRDLSTAAIADHGAVQKQPELEDFLSFVLDHGPVHNVLEVGSQDGGMLWLFSRIATGSVVSVDINQRQLAPGLPPCCYCIEGDSHHRIIHEVVEETLNYDAVDLLFIDGDHSFRGVMADFDDYQELVAHGGLIALHDIVPHGDLEQSAVSYFWASLKRMRKPEALHEFIHPVAGDTWHGLIPVASCGIGVIVKP